MTERESKVYETLVGSQSVAEFAEFIRRDARISGRTIREEVSEYIRDVWTDAELIHADTLAGIVNNA